MNAFTSLLIATLTFTAFAHAQAATQWRVDSATSQIYFTSIKKDSIAEVHHFTDISGEISPKGQAKVSINLNSAQTHIAIRNERLASYLFETSKYPSATISAQVSPEVIDKLTAGDSLQLSTEFTISLHGQSKIQPASLIINKLNDNKLTVSSAQPIIINAADYGLTDGVNKLRDLAGLPSISYAVPVTFTLTLEPK